MCRVGAAALGPPPPQAHPHNSTPPLSCRALQAGAPVMRVQLSFLADGCILAIALMHCITDGMRWPQLAAHLAARYRKCTAQRQLGTSVALPENAAELLHPCDRRLLSSGGMAEQLLGYVLGPWLGGAGEQQAAGWLVD